VSGIGEQQLLRAAARAASLDDRLDGAAGADTDPGVITGRLSQWRDNAAGGDAARFRDYLADLRLAQGDAERLVRDVVVPRAEQAPAWSHTLAAITARAVTDGDAGDPAAAAFGHLWTPAGGAARAAIEAALTAQQRGLMDAGAIDHLVTDLVAGLGELGGAVLYQDFSRLRRRLREQGRVGSRPPTSSSSTASGRPGCPHWRSATQCSGAWSPSASPSWPMRPSRCWRGCWLTSRRCGARSGRAPTRAC